MGKSRDLAGLEFITLNASVSTTTGVAATLLTLPTNGFATYILSVGILANDVANYHDVALVMTQNTAVGITLLNNSALIAITNSGLAIQVTQNSGANNTVIGRLTCLTRE